METTKWIKLMSWTTFNELRKTCNTVIIPCGATEVYGPHLPLSSDILVANRIAELVAEQTNALIGPSIEMGESNSLFMFPGTMTFSPETYAMIIKDIMTSLVEWGFKNYMFINAHAGNVPIIGQVAREFQNKYGVTAAQIDWWRFVQQKSLNILDNKNWMAHGHASECGTSVMLHLYPKLVDFSKAQKVEAQRESFARDNDIITYVRFDQTTPNGILGDALAATADKGKQIVDLCVTRIVQFMKDNFDS